MDFRTRLREQIEYVGLLDKEVAAQAGISKHTMDTYVGTRACIPSADVAVRLAKVLGVSVEWLINGEAEEIHESASQSLLHCFSQLNPHDKKVLLEIAKAMCSLSEN